MGRNKKPDGSQETSDDVLWTFSRDADGIPYIAKKNRKSFGEIIQSTGDGTAEFTEHEWPAADA